MNASTNAPASIDDVQGLLRRQGYVADRSLAVPMFLALKLERPLFLEGEAGVGKTEIARALASGLDTELIRLQCYEGLDVSHAVYEWNYARQLLEIRLMETGGSVERQEDASASLFNERFLIKRPLLQAIDGDRGKSPGVAHRRVGPGRRGVRGLSPRVVGRLPDNRPGTGNVSGMLNGRWW